MFIGFPKMSRLLRECIITEKLDGTNAQIVIMEDSLHIAGGIAPSVIAKQDNLVMLAGSRTRFIVPGDDNFGFATWVKDNATELFRLGPGQHFGEWWGQGIQRNYGLKERRFSLFNTTRWAAPYAAVQEGHTPHGFPACCSVVPVLFEGLFSTLDTEQCIAQLRHLGSVAAPEFMDPEGIVVYHTAANTMFKQTLVGDEKWKGHP